MAQKTFSLNKATSLTQQVWCWDDDVDFSSSTLWTQALADTITLSDSLSKHSIGKALADTITLSDGISRVWHSFLSLSDTITISDSVKDTVGKALSDVITVTDSIGMAFGKALSDIITLSDSISNGIRLVFADTITLSDSIIKTIGKKLNDIITLSDSLSVIYDKWKRLPEIVGAMVAKLPFGMSRPNKPSGFSDDRPHIV